MALTTVGCQSAHTFTTPDASWTSHIGQLKHTNAKRTLVGEVVVQRRAAQEFQLDFLKGGSFPLISIREDGDIARAEGLLAGGHWQGSPEKAPISLRPWLRLRGFFRQMDGTSAPPRAPASLTFRDEGQRFEFIFNR